MTGDAIYTATWKLDEVQGLVRFDANYEGGPVYDYTLVTSTENRTDSVAAPAVTRDGYTLLGWSNNPAATAPQYPADVVITQYHPGMQYAVLYAVWGLTEYTITYENVPAGVENTNPTTYTIESDEIVFAGLKCDGFIGWEPAFIPAGSFGDVTVTANIVAKPAMPTVTNVCDNLMHFQCTEHDEHNYTTKTTIDANTNRTVWNADLQCWETFVYARMVVINTTVTRETYFGNYEHYYASDAGKTPYYLYWNPTTGLWNTADGNPIEIKVWCYDKPAAVTAASAAKQIGSKGPWTRNCTNLKNQLRTNPVAEDITVLTDSLRTDDAGNFYIDVMVSSARMIEAFQNKFGEEYHVCDGVGNDGHVAGSMGHTVAASSYKYVMKFAKPTSGAIDFSKDNWKFDETATLALNEGYMRYNGYPIWMSRDFTVTYTDGVESEEIFENQEFTVREGGATPAFVGTPVREGYVFEGWAPEVQATVTENKTYEAVWSAEYTITYVGVPEGVKNSNPTSYKPGDAFTFDPLSCDGFIGWDPEGITAENSGDITVTANIVAKPVSPKASNTASNVMHIQCTEHKGHQWTTNQCISANAKVTWNAETKRWETYVYDSVKSKINLSTINSSNFGGYYHYCSDDAGKVQYELYWDTAVSQWVTLDGNPIEIEVRCFDTPTAFDAATIGKKIGDKGPWPRNCTNLKNQLRYTPVADDVVSFGEITEDAAGNFWMTVTLKGDNAVAAFQSVYGSDYHVCNGIGDDGHAEEALGHGDYVGTYKYVFKYAKPSSIIDFSKDGWKLDEDASIALNEGYVRYNGYFIWMCRDFTVTYTDGVEDEVVFEDQKFTVREGGATPTIEEPTREGYVFVGWDSEIAEKVTENATYNAQWEQAESTDNAPVFVGLRPANSIPAYGHIKLPGADFINRLLDRILLAAFWM